MDIEPTGLIPAARAAVTGAIRNAAELTGASFQYLLATARAESNLNPQASAPTSTATGPFQFVSQTWLATLKEQGPALGYARYADAIVKQPSGQYTVSDPQLYDQIMKLRTEPAASAVMAAAFTKANAAKLAGALGRPPSEGELYLAHFLGSDGATRLIKTVEAQPQTVAAQVFPAAANANPSIFYDQQKRPRSAAEVHRLLIGRYDVARANPLAPTVAAKVAPVTPAVAPAVAQTSPVPIADNRPIFHSLFRSERPEPVAPVVSALWAGAAKPVPQPATAAPAQPVAPATQPAPSAERPNGTRDLFQDQAANVRALFRGAI